MDYAMGQLLPSFDNTKSLRNEKSASKICRSGKSVGFKNRVKPQRQWVTVNLGSTSLLKRNLGIPSAVSHSTMNAVLTNEVTQGTEVIVKKFFFPKGLLGFENVKKYTLTTKSSETPFSRLRMEEGEGYTLLLLPVMGFSLIITLHFVEMTWPV